MLVQTVILGGNVISEQAREATYSPEATVSFETFGCSANQADTRLMEHYAAESGLSLVSGDADVVVLNTCTVKGPTQTAIERRIEALEKAGKKVVVAGCLSQASPDHPLFQGKSLLGPDSADQIVRAVRGAIDDVPVQITTRKKTPLPLVVPKQDPQKPFILSVSQGCLSSCSFCATKLARGNLRSHTVRHLRDVAERAIQNGHKEIYLTSQDTSAYGLDIGVTLADLLESLVSIEGEFFVRIGMANPQHFKHFKEQLWPLFESTKLYRFLHVPVQSGSETVLKDMRRDHSAQDYLDIVTEGRAHFPDLTIATDIICGYPTETEQDHQETLAVLRESLPDAVNISKFWPRPKTRAERLNPLPGHIVKRRSKEVTELFKRISRSRCRWWLGWEGEVLVTEVSKLGGYLGRNQSYKQVVLPKSESYSPGEIVRFIADDYGTYDLRSSPIEN